MHFSLSIRGRGQSGVAQTSVSFGINQKFQHTSRALPCFIEIHPVSLTNCLENSLSGNINASASIHLFNFPVLQDVPLLELVLQLCTTHFPRYSKGSMMWSSEEGNLKCCRLIWFCDVTVCCTSESQIFRRNQAQTKWQGCFVSDVFEFLTRLQVGSAVMRVQRLTKWTWKRTEAASYYFLLCALILLFQLLLHFICLFNGIFILVKLYLSLKEFLFVFFFFLHTVHSMI